MKRDIFLCEIFRYQSRRVWLWFSIDTPIFSIKKGETKYSLYPLLIGGFVKLYGEDEAGSGSIKLSRKK